MIERGREPGLADEPLAEALVLGELRREHLERDLALEPIVLGEVHDAHAAPPQRPFDAVAGDDGARLQVDTARADRGPWSRGGRGCPELGRPVQDLLVQVVAAPARDPRRARRPAPGGLARTSTAPRPGGRSGRARASGWPTSAPGAGSARSATRARGPRWSDRPSRSRPRPGARSPTAAAPRAAPPRPGGMAPRSRRRARPRATARARRPGSRLPHPGRMRAQPSPASRGLRTARRRSPPGRRRARTRRRGPRACRRPAASGGDRRRSAGCCGRSRAAPRPRGRRSAGPPGRRGSRAGSGARARLAAWGRRGRACARRRRPRADPGSGTASPRTVRRHPRERKPRRGTGDAHHVPAVCDRVAARLRRRGTTVRSWTPPPAPAATGSPSSSA